MVRIGIIGAGLMGSQHARALGNVPDAELAAIHALDGQAAQALASAHGTRAVDSLDELLGGCDLDAVIVATPTDTHAGLARAAIDAGLDAFVEKPIARTLDEARELVAAAADAGRVLQAGHVICYFHDYQRIGEQVAAGAVGTPAVATFGRRCATPDWTHEGWLASFERGGGVVLDMMIHDIDLVRWYFGEPDTVIARSVGPERHGGIDYALATFTVPDGPICHLHASWAEPEGFSQSAEVAGSAGMLSYDSRDTADVAIARHGSAGGHVTALPDPIGHDPFAEQLADFARAIRTRTAPRRDGAWALRSLELALAAIESARTRQPVQVAPGAAGLAGNDPAGAPA